MPPPNSGRVRDFCYVAFVNADALVVLGAKVNNDGYPSAALSRRLHRAAQAYRDGLAPVVLCCGGKRWPGGLEAVVMQRFLIDHGVPRYHVLTETLSRSTLENAYFSGKIAHIMGWGSLAVVSCPWHLPRVQLDFARAGWDILPVPATLPDSKLSERWFRFSSEHVSLALDLARFSIWRFT